MSAPVLATEFSGFLGNYADMQESAPDVFTSIAPDGHERASKFDAIMIDQPEFLVDDDSKYSGLKPNDMKLIVDTLRLELMKSFERSSFRLVSTPGPSTLYLRTGITEVGLKRKRMRVVQFTPIGLAATIATAPFRDVMNKIDLKRFTIEAEILESTSGERFALLVDRSRSSGDKKNKVS